MKTLAIVLLSALVGAGRFAVPGHDLSWPGTYEAFAHIWVGILIAMAFNDFQESWHSDSETDWAAPSVCLIGLTGLEVAMFMAR